MNIRKDIERVKNIIPKYWPITTFIHHNPLSSFEKLKFKDALEKAQDVFESNVYMKPDYYISLYQEGKIKQHVLEKNLYSLLEKNNCSHYFNEGRTFLIDISPRWESFKSYKYLSKICLSEHLLKYIKLNSPFKNSTSLLEYEAKFFTLYDFIDAIFDKNKGEIIEKDVIDYVSRFLDQEQTTLSMYQRNLGMFNTFKYYEGVNFKGTSLEYIEYILQTLKIPEDKIENYLLSHILKLGGWGGFIKYRERDENYYWQQEYPASITDYLAIRLHYEWKHLKNENLNNFEHLNSYIQQNKEKTLLKILEYKNKLPAKYVDLLENNLSPEEVLKLYFEEQIKLKAVQIQMAKKELPFFKGDLVEFAKFTDLLKKEEGYIWLKSLEDSYIETYVREISSKTKNIENRALASLVMCIDVRSEAIRRYFERIGSYTSYGIAGFLGIPVAFIEFDKNHEQFLCPAIVKPRNVVFEVPQENYEDYKTKKSFTKTLKKVLNDLKNNPYTPFITVEAIGWIFGINLFGKTFFPKQIEKFYEKFKPKKPKTDYLIDKLSQDEIEFFAKELHFKIINEVVSRYLKRNLTKFEIEEIWEHLVFGKKLVGIDINNEILMLLKTKYNITKEDYEFQKQKLSQVGFSLDEQVRYLENFLKTIGLVDKFPKFILIVGHGSKSDNNPFESALDCGACGGNSSFPNAKIMCMIGNRKDVRNRLKEKGIYIPDDVKFIPGIHITTTDEIAFYDTEILNEEEKEIFKQIQEDINFATSRARQERMKTLPYTEKEEDIFIKAIDWSEPRPEWGLSKNMATYIGKRETIKHLSLYNRFFLISYDWEVDDEKASILTSILNGPLVVGSWINMEHYFSTVDNNKFGAGSKVYHNVVAKIGVFSGNYSDLKIGLPLQSVFLENKPYHEPVRLITFLEAPLDFVLNALKASNLGNYLINNEWVRLIVIDKKSNSIYSFENGDFHLLEKI